MKVRWKKLLARMAVWLAFEILFNFLGLDDLADYGEFVFETSEVTLLDDWKRGVGTRVVRGCGIPIS